MAELSRCGERQSTQLTRRQVTTSMTTSPALSIILLFVILAPLLGAAILAALPALSEKTIARIAALATFISAVCAVIGIGAWLIVRISHTGAAGAAIFTPEIPLVHVGDYHFDAGLSMTVAAAAFLFLVEFTSGMVIRFSRNYMHREPGFRRFFAIVLMFQGAMALLTLASHLDLLFFGWEMVGLASFLLIAFYHERRTPVRNALKIFSIYRVADIGLFLSAFLEKTTLHTSTGFLLLLAAAGKSAQFPFSFWIVRAMEGPTPSSALFYGALSVNAGAYLLLKTYPIWGASIAVHIAVGMVGLTTAILCSLFSRTQHTVKGQVGYASATQVGIIFVELALGLRGLALFHMVSNALFRCYQLLVSPSAVAYLLRRQSASGYTKPSEEHSLFQRLFTREGRSTLFVFSISEGYLEDALFFLFWQPLRWLSTRFDENKKNLFWVVIVVAACIGVVFHFHNSHYARFASIILIGLAAVFSAKSLGSFKKPSLSVSWLLVSTLFVSTSVWMETTATIAVVFYAISVSCVGALAILGLSGIISSRPIASVVSLIGVLGLTGFSLLPTFFGEDMLLHEAFKTHPLYAFSLSCLFALNGYIAMRNFAQGIWVTQRT